jgi:serine/threonine protein phosphatase PrpC
VRDHNEDFLDAFSPAHPVQLRRKGVLFIVADGMGGHQAGDVASRSAVEMVSHEYYADPDPDARRSLVRSVRKANELIFQEAQRTPTRAGMGTTLVAAVVRGRELLLANVGDSRGYIMRQGEVFQTTRDHSFVAEQVRAGLLTPEEARTHPQRNVITRALGSRPDVTVDTYVGELQPGDALLLCSDGLSEYVRDEDMLAAMSQYPPAQAVSRLIALANQRGGSDNISALVVRANGPDSGPTTVSVAPATAPLYRVVPRWRPRLPWIAAGAAGVVVIGVVALVAAGVLVPRFFSRASTTATVEARSTATARKTSAPTVTVAAGTARPSIVPVLGFALEAPVGGVTVPSGTVELRWHWNAPAPEDVVTFVVKANDETVCEVESEAELCLLDAVEGEAYEWWVELQAAGLKARESEHESFRAGPAVTREPTVTVTLVTTDTAQAAIQATGHGSPRRCEAILSDCARFRDFQPPSLAPGQEV